MGRRARARTERVPGEARVARSAAAGEPARMSRWERAKARPKRRRREWEAPGTILGGPPIAVTCECGEKHDAAYGEVWACERCGRRWDTNQIPRAQYEVVRRADAELAGQRREERLRRVQQHERGDAGREHGNRGAAKAGLSTAVLGGRSTHVIPMLGLMRASPKCIIDSVLMR